MPISKSKTHYFYLVIASFVFISSFALSLSQPTGQNPQPLPQPRTEKKLFNPNPVLKDNFSNFPIISAQAALAIDLKSLTPLYEKNPELLLLPASTTKIITALVALDYYQDNDILKATGATRNGSDMGLIEGEEITAGNLLDALLIKSANDAAEVLAFNYPGGKAEFIKAMNDKAQEYHLENSHFDNPVGFDGVSNYSTAKDLVRISIEAMQNPRFAARVKIKEKTVTDIHGNIKHKLTATNKLLSTVDGVLGIKTGWTEEARENLITYIEKDGKPIIIAVLGSQDRFGETTKLINWIYSSYDWQTVGYSVAVP